MQVAWNKTELSAHDLEPEQQERLFAGKHSHWPETPSSEKYPEWYPHCVKQRRMCAVHARLCRLRRPMLSYTFAALSPPCPCPCPAAEIRVLRTLHHRNIITCYEW